MLDLAATLKHWRMALQSGRQALRDEFAAGLSAARLLRAHAGLVDAVLRELATALQLPPSTALLAVGGYGRGQLFPYSDVDVLVLLPDQLDRDDRQTIERFVAALWDVGLDIGHSVRTIQECVAEMANDVTIATTLLETRYLWGDRRLYQRFRRHFRNALDPLDFYRAKLLEQQQRHLRFQDAASNLEPNLKESPGGLRDLQTIFWITRGAGLGTTWRSLVQRGWLTGPEANQAHRNETLLNSLRIQLHYLAGRREDRLVFDLQTKLAAEFGFRETAERRASEALMQRYYRAAKSIRQVNAILLQNLGLYFEPPTVEPAPLDDCFQVLNEYLDLRDPAAFERNPGKMLDAFVNMARHPELKGMTAPTLRALWRNRHRIDHAFRRDPANRQRFLDLLRAPRGITHELRRMNQYGILGRYIPAFGRVVGQMQHDLFHVYTVDEHILMVVRNLRRFLVPKFSHEYPLCSRLAMDFERPEVLYLAGLFHDIAKGRGGDHSTLGAVDAERFCRQHGLPEEDGELVRWLVANHLTMSSTAQKQDITDPDVVTRFAQIVGTERRLVALYLLTVADIRGTSPKVWNNWKARLLEDLYGATRRCLAGDSVTLSLQDSLQARQEDARRILRLYATREHAEDKLWAQLDMVYFQRHTADEIAWHTRNLFYRVDAPQPVVKTRLGRSGEGLQVMVYLKDRPEIFSRICGFFGRMAFSIVEAKIHTTRHGYALDSFLVLDPAQDRSAYRDVINLIEYELSQALMPEAPAVPPANGRISRHLKHFPLTPEVSLIADERGSHHILSIVAGDRPGLLAQIAGVLNQHRVNVQTAKINTLGDRAEDVFIVSGPGLSDPATQLRLETALLSTLRT